MIGKTSETFLCLLSIGVLQQNAAALICQTNRDCSSETSTSPTKQCCDKVFPPKCMDRVMCQYLHGNDVTKPTSVYYPKFTDPGYETFTPPPDYKFKALPDVRESAVPNFAVGEVPESSYDDYDYDDDDNHGYINQYHDNSGTSTKLSSGAILAIAISIFVLIIFLLFFYVCYLALNENHLQENCNMPPPATTNTSPTNFVEEPSRIVMIAESRDEDHVRRQNRHPDDELPLLSQEDILLGLHNRQPRPYVVQATTEPHLPQYEGLDNAAMDQPSTPAYFEVQLQPTSQNSMNSSQIRLSPNVPPPSYEEAMISI